MELLMGKNKKVKEKEQKSIFSEQLLKEDIIEAIIEANEIMNSNKEKREEEEKQKRISEWEKTLGVKDYSYEKNSLKKDQVREGQISILLISTILIFLFRILECGCYIVGLIYFVALFSVKHSSLKVLTCIVISISVIGIARFFRLAALEVDKIENKEFLISIFTTWIAILTIVVSIVSIVIN